MKTIIIIQFLLAFFIGILALIIIYKAVNYFMKKQYSITENNNAFAVFQTGIILSGSLILSSIINPAVSAIRILNQGNEIAMNSILTTLGYVALFVVIGIICTLVVIAVGLFILFQLTHENEGEEIKKNNIGVALVTGAIIVGLSIILDEYVGHLCEALIPYPQVPRFF